MTAANAAPNVTDAALDLLRLDVRTGHALIATFRGPAGLSWVELLGPKGMRPDGTLLVAPVPTLRLCIPTLHQEPLAVAANDGDFDGGLRAIVERARPYLHPVEAESLQTMLRVVRRATKARGPRVPEVGERISQTGSPSLHAWASCLTLGDLEAALSKAVA